MTMVDANDKKEVLLNSISIVVGIVVTSYLLQTFGQPEFPIKNLVIFLLMLIVGTVISFLLSLFLFWVFTEKIKLV